MTRASLVFTLLTALPGASASLYAPAPPQNAAFFRVMNLESGSNALIPTLNGEALSRVAFRAVSAYVVAKSGPARVVFGRASSNLNVQAGRFYTAVLRAGKLSVINDPLPKNRTRVLVNFYNFSGGPLSLKTADGKLEVVAQTGVGQVSTREVNPLRATFGLFRGTARALSLSPVTLERGGGYSVVALTSGGKLEALVVRNTTEGS